MSETTARTVDLVASTDREHALRRRHRDYYDALAAEGASRRRGPDQRRWTVALDQEHDNLRLALDWSLEHRDVDEALRLAVAVHDVWDKRGEIASAHPSLDDALEVAESRPSRGAVEALLRKATVVPGPSTAEQYAAAQQALEMARGLGADDLVARTLCCMANRQFRQHAGGHSAARAFLDESVAIARRHGDDLLLADTLKALAWMSTDQDEVRAAHDEALELYRRAGDMESAAWIQYTMAWADDENASTVARECLATGLELGDPVLVGYAYEALGYTSQCRGDLVGAIAVTEEALQVVRTEGAWLRFIGWVEDWILCNLSVYETERGAFDRGLRWAEECLERRDRVTDYYAALAEAYAGFAMVGLGDHRRGLARIEAALDGLRAGAPPAVFYLLHLIGRAAYGVGDVDRARAAAEEIVASLDWALFYNVGTIGSWLLADLQIDAGELDAATATLARCADLQPDNRRRATEPMTQVRRARLAIAQGDLESARALYGAALTRLGELGHGPGVALALEELARLASRVGQDERAAVLYGAASRLRDECQTAVPIEERRRHADGLEQLHDALDEATIGARMAEGAALSHDETTVFALEGDE